METNWKNKLKEMITVRVVMKDDTVKNFPLEKEREVVKYVEQLLHSQLKDYKEQLKKEIRGMKIDTGYYKIQPDYLDRKRHNKTCDEIIKLIK